MISSIGSPAFHSDAVTALDSASTEATERSISAAMITSASGSAISATSEKSSEPVVNESVVRNSDEMPWPAITVTTISPSSSASQRPANARRRVVPEAAGGGRGPGRCWRARSTQPARRALLLRSAASTRRASSRSKAIASSSSAPTAASCQNASTRRTISDEVIVPSSSAPSAAP